MHGIESVWNRIEVWLAQEAPHLLSQLQPAPPKRNSATLADDLKTGKYISKGGVLKTEDGATHAHRWQGVQAPGRSL